MHLASMNCSEIRKMCILLNTCWASCYLSQILQASKFSFLCFFNKFDDIQNTSFPCFDHNLLSSSSEERKKNTPVLCSDSKTLFIISCATHQDKKTPFISNFTWHGSGVASSLTESRVVSLITSFRIKHSVGPSIQRSPVDSRLRPTPHSRENTSYSLFRICCTLLAFG